MKYFICRPCEGKYPKRQDNIFIQKRALRKHLRIEHKLRHYSNIIKKPSNGLYKCRCLNVLDKETGKPKYFIEMYTS